MDLLAYLDKRVYINLISGFYYEGMVVDATEQDITIIDKRNKRVSIRLDAILRMAEL